MTDAVRRLTRWSTMTSWSILKARCCQMMARWLPGGRYHLLVTHTPHPLFFIPLPNPDCFLHFAPSPLSLTSQSSYPINDGSSLESDPIHVCFVWPQARWVHFLRALRASASHTGPILISQGSPDEQRKNIQETIRNLGSSSDMEANPNSQPQSQSQPRLYPRRDDGI